MPVQSSDRSPSFLPTRRRGSRSVARIGPRLLLSLLLAVSLTRARPAGADLADRPTRSVDERFADGDLDAFDPLPSRPGDSARRRGGLYLTVAGSMKPSPTAVERAAFVVLGLPFDALFQARPPPPSPQRVLYTDSAPAPVNVPVASAELPPPSPALARAVVHAALRAAGVSDGHSRLDDLASRARRSALLPETRLRATRYVDDRASVDALPEQSRLVDSSAHTVGLEARLTFRLDRLVFADEEPHLERARLDLEAFRAKLASKALELLFRHHRARVAAASATSGAGREEETIAVAELTAALDALTGGFFSRATTAR